MTRRAAVTAARCQWCGVFIAADTQPATRRTLGIKNGWHRWRVFRQLLCPDCRNAALTPMPWNEPL